MAKLTALVASTLAAASLTLAASTSEAAPVAPTAHLTFMYGLVAGTLGNPANNTWANGQTACNIDWANNVALTKGACFLTLALRQAEPTFTSSEMFKYWGASSPSSPTYHDLIATSNRFMWRITDVGELLEGDILSTKYLSQSGTNTGYTMVVSTVELYAIEPDGTERYLLEVIDSTTDPHGAQDTRWNGDPTTSNGHVQGVGVGQIFIDADPVTGAVIQHTWSNQGQQGSSYYTQAQRHLELGRFDRSKITVGQP